MRIEERSVHAATIGLAQEIIDYIEERLSEPFNPATIAEHFHDATERSGMISAMPDIRIPHPHSERSFTIA